MSAVQDAGREASEWTSDEGHFRPGRRLLLHLFGAYEMGWLTLEQDCELLNRAFTSARPEDSSHVWWSYFRSWTDSQHAIRPESVARMVEFWDWRLTHLERAGESERRRVEAEGFGWLAMAEAIPDADMLPLLLRSVSLSGGRFPVSGALWERLGRMATHDVRAAVEVAGLLIRAELEGEFAHFNFTELAPVLRSGLQSGDAEARENAERAIHLLGEHGFEQFGDLLNEQPE